jgi:hypothetical protein
MFKLRIKIVSLSMLLLFLIAGTSSIERRTPRLYFIGNSYRHSFDLSDRIRQFAEFANSLVLYPRNGQFDDFS